MGFATIEEAGAEPLFPCPLLDNLGSTNLMVVDWFGLSESNVTPNGLAPQPPAEPAVAAEGAPPPADAAQPAASKRSEPRR